MCSCVQLASHFSKGEGDSYQSIASYTVFWAESNEPDQVIGISERKISKMKASALKTNPEHRQDACIYLRN